MKLINDYQFCWTKAKLLVEKIEKEIQSSRFYIRHINLRKINFNNFSEEALKRFLIFDSIKIKDNLKELKKRLIVNTWRNLLIPSSQLFLNFSRLANYSVNNLEKRYNHACLELFNRQNDSIHYSSSSNDTRITVDPWNVPPTNPKNSAPVSSCTRNSSPIN